MCFEWPWHAVTCIWTGNEAQTVIYSRNWQSIIEWAVKEENRLRFGHGVFITDFATCFLGPVRDWDCALTWKCWPIWFATQVSHSTITGDGSLRNIRRWLLRSLSDPVIAFIAIENISDDNLIDDFHSMVMLTGVHRRGDKFETNRFPNWRQ